MGLKQIVERKTGGDSTVDAFRFRERDQPTIDDDSRWHKITKSVHSIESRVILQTKLVFNRKDSQRKSEMTVAQGMGREPVEGRRESWK